MPTPVLTMRCQSKTLVVQTDGTNWVSVSLQTIPPTGTTIPAMSGTLNETMPVADDSFVIGALYTVTLSDVAITLTPSSATPVAAGGAASFTVATSATWTPVSDSTSWLTVTSPTGSTTGNGTVNYNVAANSGAQRIGKIAIGGQQFTVTQAAA